MSQIKILATISKEDGEVEKVLYWGAPVFTQAERLWNRLCVEYIRSKGFTVVLPQEEAVKFIGPGRKMNIDQMVLNCYDKVVECPIVVVILDGADSDSGASLEAGVKVHQIKTGFEGMIIGVRTDFRGSEDERLNAMFRLLNARLIYEPIDDDYKKLCDQIIATIERF